MTKIVPNSPKAWLLAARPKTLTAALSPVLIATALALPTLLHPAGSGCPIDPSNVLATPPFGGIEGGLVALLCLLFAALMQIAANFINDFFDFRRGTDNEERLGPERACQQGWVTPRAMKIAIGITLSLAAATGLGILYLTCLHPAVLPPRGELEGGLLLVLGAACIVFAFLYTTLLSYCGGGDVLVWVFFGFVPVLGTFYVLTGTLSPDAWLLAAATGLVTDTLLVINNYRDRDGDRRSGKRTLIVVFGERFGAYFYLLQGLAGVVLAACVAPKAAVLYIIHIYAHARTWRKMCAIRTGRALNGILGRTSLNMLLFTVLTVVAVLLK